MWTAQATYLSSQMRCNIGIIPSSPLSLQAPQPSVTVIKSSTELAYKRLTQLRLQGHEVMAIRWSITYLKGYLSIKKVILEVFSYAFSSGARGDGSLPIGYALTGQGCLCKFTKSHNFEK